MANFADLGLEYKTDYRTVKIAETEVKILTDLTTAEKYDLIMITVQEAMEDGYVNPFKLDMFFHTNLVLMYTDIVFTKEELTDMAGLYDVLNTNNIISMVITAIGSEQYNTMFNWVTEVAKSYAEYRTSTAAMISSVINDLPKQAEAMKEIIDNFDPEQYQNVIDFANAAGMINKN